MSEIEHWRRDEPAFYNFLALERGVQDAPDVLAGLRGALMSRDLRSDALTLVLELPAGWRGRTDAALASLELFVLRGQVSLDGVASASGGYVHLPQLCGGGELASDGGALVLAFWNPNLPCYPYPVTRKRVVSSWALDWLGSMPGAHGVMHKSLRVPDPVPHPLDEGFDGGPGGYLRLQYIAPQMIADMEHVHHECWEEIIVLQGDVLLLNEGQMGLGSVVSHPQEWYHAPFVSRSGAVILVHTDAPMGYPWPPRPYPHGRALCEAYLAEAPWDVPTEHCPWHAHPLAARQEADPEYRAWRTSPAGARWGGAERAERVPQRPGGRGTASAFRASWKRSPPRAEQPARRSRDHEPDRRRAKMPETPLKRVPREELPEDLKPVWDLAKERVGDATAIEAWANHIPMLDWYFNGFYKHVFYNADARMQVDVRTKELLRIKLSKQHGCFFCNRWNSVDCLAAGITQEQIDNVLQPTPQHFDAKDLAVIELADQMMLQNMTGQLTPELYRRLRRYYSDAQIVEMGFVAAVLTGMAKYVFVFDLVDREEICPIERRPVA